MFSSIYRFLNYHYHTRYHGVYRHARQLFVFDLVLLALAIVLLGGTIFFFFWKPDLTDFIDLNLSLGAERIRSGEEVTLNIGWTNRSKYSLNHPILAVRLPPGFIINRAKTPENLLSAQSTLALPTILPGARGHDAVSGWLWTRPKNDARIMATLSYFPSNNPDRPEQKIAAFTANLPDSIILEEIRIATSTFPNQKVPFALLLKNTANRTLTGVSVSYQIAPALASGHESAGTGGNAASDKITLAPGELKTINGWLMSPSSAAHISLTASVSVAVNGVSLEQAAATQTIETVSPSVASAVRLTNPVAYGEPGGSIPITVSWKKAGGVLFKNMVIRLTPTPGTVDLKQTALLNNFKIDSQSLIIDGNRRTALAPTINNAADEFTATLKLLPGFSLGDASPGVLEIKPSISAELPSIAGQIFNQPGAALDVPLATELTLSTEARYYTPEGDQLGRGPLPPAAGQTTRYWIFVRLLNTTNAVRDLAFRTTLAPGVTFTGKQSVTIGPELSADASGAVSWRYPSIPPHSETGLYFEVAVQPARDQIGRTLPLTGPIIVMATDDAVGKTFNLANHPLDNQLPKDDRGSALPAAVRP